MKNTVVLFAMCLMTVSAVAQSTCETRVDAHQDATTKQRVAYCLTPQAIEAPAGPGLIFSGVTTRHAPEKKPYYEQSSKYTGSFDGSEVSISRNFVETNRFPKLTDGRVSEQEKLAHKAALAEGEKLAQEAAQQTDCEPQAEPEQVKPIVEETATGLKARKTKPSRRWHQTTKEEIEAPQADLEQWEEVAPMADTYTYDGTADTTAGASSYAPYSSSEEIPSGTSSYAPTEGAGTATGGSYAPADSYAVADNYGSYAPAN